MNTENIFNSKYYILLAYILLLTALMSISACGGDDSVDRKSPSIAAPTPPPPTQNASPTVNTGSNQTVNASDTVNLSANASDSDGTIQSYFWEQISGNSVNLSSTQTQNTSFIAPSSDITQNYTFRITVTDNDNAVSADEIMITVNPAIRIGQANLSWTAPVENTDNSQLTDLAGFKIYYGSSRDNLNNSITIDSAVIDSYTVDNLIINQTYYFAITAFNRLNIESELSNISTKTI